MNMKLTVYTDDSLTEVAKVVEADKLKIPYRVSMYIVQSLDNVSLNNEDDLIAFVSKNIGYMDKIIKATFNVTDSELECIETTELIDMVKELYIWGINKLNSIGGNSKNV